MNNFSKYISDLGNYFWTKIDYYLKCIAKNNNDDDDDIESLPLNLDLFE
jgi:hypothetical protein